MNYEIFQEKYFLNRKFPPAFFWFNYYFFLQIILREIASTVKLQKETFMIYTVEAHQTDFLNCQSHFIKK